MVCCSTNKKIMILTFISRWKSQLARHWLIFSESLKYWCLKHCEFSNTSFKYVLQMKSAQKWLLRKKYSVHQTKQAYCNQYESLTKLVSWLTSPHHWLRLLTHIPDSRLCQILSESRMVTMLCVLIESKQNCIMWYTLCHRRQTQFLEGPVLQSLASTLI